MTAGKTARGSAAKHLRRMKMKKQGLIILFVSFVFLSSCVSNSPKLFKETHQHFDNIGSEYRMPFITEGDKDETYVVSICFYERINQSNAFVLLFERTIGFAYIDSDIATHRALGITRTRNDYFLTGKVNVLASNNYNDVRFTLEATNIGVSRIPTEKYVKEIFQVYLTTEILSNLFPDDIDRIFFGLAGTRSFGISSDIYQETKTQVFQFIEKYKDRL